MRVCELLHHLNLRGTSVAFRQSSNGRLEYLYENGKISADANMNTKYENANIKEWHVEPNLEDNGSVNWAYPCRIVIDIKG